MTKEQLWQSTLGELELLISKANFTTWFKNTYIDSYIDDQVIISVPNTFTKVWLEKKYNDQISKALQNITNKPIKSITYQVSTNKPTPSLATLTPTIINNHNQTPSNKTPLNPNYIFENFVVGKNNELARAAAIAVAQNPGTAYNPLFLYGGVGLGKTHLLQAIGHEIIKNFPDKKIVYVTCERFTNDFIEAISKGHAEKFKNNYRNIDVLLIDDIQFLAGKEGTQEEFFHTFNTLHQANKQIVLTSDRPPKAIPTLEHRLVSRFEWGMLADILSPDLETRTAILDTKCKEKGLILDNKIINHIANTVQNNIRELEGALNKIIAYHQLNNQAPTLESVALILQSGNQPRNQAVTTKKIIHTVAKYFDIDINDLLSSSRKRQLVVPRQIAMYLMRKEARSSFPAIGQELGGRDHTTAIHACEKIERDLLSNNNTQQDIHLIKQRLYEN